MPDAHLRVFRGSPGQDGHFDEFDVPVEEGMVVLDALHRVNEEWGTTIVVVTHDPDVAARLPRTVTIRDGRVGSEGRAGEEYAVVSADGSLPLPAAAVDAFPPGALVRVHHVDGVWTLIPQNGVPADG